MILTEMYHGVKLPYGYCRTLEIIYFLLYFQFKYINDKTDELSPLLSSE